jgi:hypothetical protein
MAISLVYGDASGQPNGADVEFSFAGRGLAENDVVVVVGGHASTGSNAGVSTSGYTELFDLTTGVRCSGSWKRMGASPDSVVTCIGSGSLSDGTAYAVMVFRGVDTTTAIDATSTTATGTGDPNSPSITTVTNAAAVISAFQMKADVNTATQPTGYSIGDNGFGTAGDTNAACAGISYKIITSAGAENPSPWTGLDDTGSYAAVSIALRPAIISVISSGVLSATGTGTVSIVGIYDPAGPFSMTGTGTATFTGNPAVDAPASMTGTGTVSWEGNSISTSPVPFSMTGTGTASFVGSLQNASALAATGTGRAEFSSSPIYSIVTSMTGTVTPFFVGATTKLSHVREVVESRGAATVTIS